MARTSHQSHPLRRSPRYKSTLKRGHL
ncbi:hypothetical protein FXO09_06840 [Microcystis aeruginosa KLA2]|nr:hypothetical protein FXO09_06840 [Microcystis aeruginosa KLA2]